MGHIGQIDGRHHEQDDRGQGYLTEGPHPHVVPQSFSREEQRQGHRRFESEIEEHEVRAVVDTPGLGTQDSHGEPERCELHGERPDARTVLHPTFNVILRPVARGRFIGMPRLGTLPYRCHEKQWERAGERRGERDGQQVERQARQRREGERQQQAPHGAVQVEPRAEPEIGKVAPCQADGTYSDRKGAQAGESTDTENEGRWRERHECSDHPGNDRVRDRCRNRFRSRSGPCSKSALTLRACEQDVKGSGCQRVEHEGGKE